MPEKAYIKLSLFDICGREVEPILNNYFESGSYEVTLNSTNLTSGIYFYKLVSEGYSQSRKTIIIK